MRNSILNSYLWEDWFQNRPLAQHCNFTSYLDFLFCDSHNGYAFYEGRLRQKTQELEESRESDKPFYKEFRIEIKPDVMYNPILAQVPTFPMDYFLKTSYIHELKELGLVTRDKQVSVLNQSPLLNFPAIIDYNTLCLGLIFGKTLLSIPGYFSDKKFIDSENSQAWLVMSSLCVMTEIVKSIPRGDFLLEKFLKDIMSNMEYLTRPNEFYVKAKLNEYLSNQ